jgi:hypothetical protein
MIREKRKRKSSDPEKRDPEKKQRKQDGFKIALLLDTRREDDRSLEKGLRRTTPGLETEVHGKPKSKTPVIDWDEEDSSSSSDQETSTDDSLGPLQSVSQAEGRMDRGTPESFRPRESTQVQVLEERTKAVKRKSQTNTIMPCEKQTARSRSETGNSIREAPRILSSAREVRTVEIVTRSGPSIQSPRPCGRNTRIMDDIPAGKSKIDRLEKIVKAAMHRIDTFEANGGHKDPTVLPTVTGSLHHVLKPDHYDHPTKDANFLEWGRNTVKKNLTAEGVSSCEQVISNIGTLVRIDVGEFLTSRDKGGDNPVVLDDKILYEESHGSWKTGHISGIWRTKCGRFYYEIQVDSPISRQSREKDVYRGRQLAKEDQYTWRTIGGLQLVLRPQWSRHVDCATLNEQAIPEEEWNDKLRWKHANRTKIAAENAELLQYLEDERKPSLEASKTKMRRIRLAQMKTFEEKCNQQYLELTLKEVSKDGEKSGDTTHPNVVMNAKWCKFHNDWAFHNEDSCNENPDSSNYAGGRGYKRGYSSMQ